MRHPDDHPEFVAHQCQRLGDQARAFQRTVDEPRFERIDNQPKARVRTEIQKGMKMQSSVKSRATGPPRTHKSATA